MSVLTTKLYERKQKGLCRRCGAIPDGKSKYRCQKCHEEHLKYQIKAKKKAIDAGLCRSCLTKPHQTGSLCNSCSESGIIRSKNQYKNFRDACYEAYGGCCACCGNDNKKYLQIDHILNDGGLHRKLMKTSLAKWAHNFDYPPTLQLLCANCHQAKTIHGGCTSEDHPLKSNK